MSLPTVAGTIEKGQRLWSRLLQRFSLLRKTGPSADSSISDACSHSRRGNVLATKFVLLDAIGMGFHEYEVIRSDPDLTALKTANPQAFEQMLKSSANP